MSTTEHPLQWPAGWPRTADFVREDGSRFKQHGERPEGGSYTPFRPVTLDVARRKLFAELDRLGATDAVLSMSRVSADAKFTREPGVALYFSINRRQMAMACDRFDNRAANIRSLGLAIEAMRQLERHGGGAMVERAFAGFAALPPPKPWWDILEVRADASREAIEANFRRLARDHHPDRGGSTAKMAEINQARDEALRSNAA